MGITGVPFAATALLFAGGAPRDLWVLLLLSFGFAVLLGATLSRLVVFLMAISVYLLRDGLPRMEVVGRTGSQGNFGTGGHVRSFPIACREYARVSPSS